MSNIIVIYKDPNDETNYYWLVPNNAYNLDFICKKDIPLGSPYNIVSASVLPNNFWKEKDFYSFDFSNPDGYGSGSYKDINGELIESPYNFSYELFIQNGDFILK